MLPLLLQLHRYILLTNHYRRSIKIWAIQTKAPIGNSQMLWACFGFGSRTDLVVMDGDQNAKRGGITFMIGTKGFSALSNPAL
jgi:hypothetical protein